MFPLLAALFGGGFTLATAYGLGAVLWRRSAAPPEILLASGIAAESLLVFLLLLCHAAVWPVFLGVGAAAIASLRWRGALADGLTSRPHVAGIAILAAYGVYYLVNALAPEVQPDGITYHLGLPYEYVRLAGFPDHLRFYDAIPQGMEMLFTVAFAFGRHAAAKLVELGIFTATLPLIFRLGRRLGISDTGSLLVAVFYWTAPVVGLTGSSSYNDAALVFFTLAAFYLLLTWRDTGERGYLLPAGALAGFCYAIKFPGIFSAVAAMLFVAVMGKRRLRNAILLAAGIAATVAPWMIRNGVLTRNPIAPLGNSAFPNAYFHSRTEHELTAGMRSLHDIAPRDVPWELALGDGLSGTFGPLLFFLPMALLASRNREGRWCLAAAVILAIPWWNNTGARFLMPAVALSAFALASALSRPTAWILIAFQAVVCWPPLLNAWQPAYTFRLHELPVAAALGLESEEHYVQRRTGEYYVAKLLEQFTPPDAHIYSLIPVATAYAARDVSVTWQSAEGDRLLEALRAAGNRGVDPLTNWRAAWPPTGIRAVRIRASGHSADEWDIAEIQLSSGGERIFNSPLWSLRAWPNVWDAPLAFDNRRVTEWRTWQPIRRGAFLEVDLDHPQTLTEALIVSRSRAPMELYGQGMDGKWRLLSGRPAMETRGPDDLRFEATALVRRSGYPYILARLGNEGNGPLANQMLAEAPLWGLRVAGTAGSNVLFKIN